eukprot:m.259551 g.259551  ORF g.259551 m.259551 type:complete len:82 (+) comp15555_c0_seq1:4039-4284(+)
MESLISRYTAQGGAGKDTLRSPFTRSNGFLITVFKRASPTVKDDRVPCLCIPRCGLEEATWNRIGTSAAITLSLWSDESNG